MCENFNYYYVVINQCLRRYCRSTLSIDTFYRQLSTAVDNQKKGCRSTVSIDSVDKGLSIDTVDNSQKWAVDRHCRSTVSTRACRSTLSITQKTECRSTVSITVDEHRSIIQFSLINPSHIYRQLSTVSITQKTECRSTLSIDSVESELSIDSVDNSKN